MKYLRRLANTNFNMQPINTALLSFGMSGWVFHAPFITTHKGFRFHSVWERSKNLAAQKYPGVITYRTLHELLNDKEVELVIVNTPNFTHFDYAKDALLAGKHVVVEKPFTTTPREAIELIDLAESQQKVLSVFQNRRYDSDYKTACKIVREKLLGKIVEAEFHFDRYKEELSEKVHKETSGAGTGALYDLGAHLIDQSLQLFGIPESIFADIRIIRPLSKVDDYFEVLLYYPELRVRLHSTYFAREPIPAFSIHGTKGSFIKSRADVQEELLQSNEIPGGVSWGKEPAAEMGILHTEKDGKIVNEKIPSLQGNYGEYYAGIHEAIRDHLTPPVTGADGLNVIRIIEAAYKSSKERRVVDLDS